MKTCSRCKKSKPYSNFGKLTASTDGYKYDCKDCRAEQAKRRYANNKPHILMQEKIWRDNNRERFTEMVKKAKLANPEKVYKQTKKWRFKNKQKYKCHRTIQIAKVKGTIMQPDKCEKCGVITALDAHHNDYSKPYEVKWLCRACHRLHHSFLGVAV